MPFYTYSQNNSGGGFDIDESRGIGHYVIVEASDTTEAAYRAGRVGLYFDGVSAGIDCDCCGDRWSTPWWEKSGDAVPSIYGKPIESLLINRESYAVRPNLTFVHYADGRVVVQHTY